jgi:hypothetical protein
MSDDVLIAMAQAKCVENLVSGAKTVEIPAALFNSAGDEAQQAVRTACRAMGMELRVGGSASYSQVAEANTGRGALVVVFVIAALGAAIYWFFR